MGSTLLVAATWAEVPPSLRNYTYVTGVGKVQAAAGLVAAVETYRPTKVVSYGTCAARAFDIGTPLWPTEFEDGDFDAASVSEVVGEEQQASFTILESRQSARHGTVRVVSSDMFVDRDEVWRDEGVLRDMESYVYAAVTTQGYHLPYLCLKVVSDTGGDDAREWRKVVPTLYQVTEASLLPVALEDELVWVGRPKELDR